MLASTHILAGAMTLEGVLKRARPGENRKPTLCGGNGVTAD